PQIVGFGRMQEPRLNVLFTRGLVPIRRVTGLLGAGGHGWSVSGLAGSEFESGRAPLRLRLPSGVESGSLLPLPRPAPGLTFSTRMLIKRAIVFLVCLAGCSFSSSHRDNPFSEKRETDDAGVLAPSDSPPGADLAGLDLSMTLAAGAAVLTQHNDVARTGA